MHLTNPSHRGPICPKWMSANRAYRLTPKATSSRPVREEAAKEAAEALPEEQGVRPGRRGRKVDPPLSLYPLSFEEAGMPSWR